MAQEYRPTTPPGPPYSPLTPVFAHLDPVAAGNATIVPPPLSPSPTTTTFPNLSSTYQGPPPAVPPVFKPQPQPVPISESENPDAIALRSAISILQLQKQQSVRDIKTLERIKAAAAADPEGFLHDLTTGRLKTKDRGAVLQFTHDDTVATDKTDNEEPGKQATDKDTSAFPFGPIPPPQNVVRMPPINWAKYQVVGEPLDRIHQEQLRRPSTGEPAPEYNLASPYRPLVDHLETPDKLRRPSKAKKTV